MAARPLVQPGPTTATLADSHISVSAPPSLLTLALVRSDTEVQRCLRNRSRPELQDDISPTEHISDARLICRSLGVAYNQQTAFDIAVTLAAHQEYISPRSHKDVGEVMQLQIEREKLINYCGSVLSYEQATERIFALLREATSKSS